jgi:hypothetical protein
MPASEVARCDHTRLRRRMLTGQFDQDLIQAVNDELKSIERADAWGKPDPTGNLFRPTCAALSQLYAPDQPRVGGPAANGLGPLPRGGEVVVAALVGAGWWDLMVRGQRDTIGMREWLLRIDAVPDPSEPLGWALALRPAYADRVVAKSRRDALDLPGWIAEAICTDLGDGRGERWVWDVWSAEGEGYHEIRDDLGPSGVVYLREPAPLDELGRPVVPYSLYHAERTGVLWDHKEWREIVDGSLRLCVDWTFYGHALLKASWPQRLTVGVLFGSDVDEGDADESGDARARHRVVSDPAKVLQGQVDPEHQGQPIVHQWAAGADLREIAESITIYERRIAALAGINPADIQRVTGDPRSGYAIEISREEQERARKRFEPTFRRGDLETIRVAAAVLGSAAGVRLPGRGYAIEYGPPGEAESAATSPFAQVGLPALIEAGIISRAAARKLLGMDETSAPSEAELAALNGGSDGGGRDDRGRGTDQGAGFGSGRGEGGGGGGAGEAGGAGG